MTPEQLEAHRLRFEQRYTSSQGYSEGYLLSCRRGKRYTHATVTAAWQAYQWALDDMASLQEAPNAWADLWYFVMDEEPMAFEKIVTECNPVIWHSEAHKLMRAKHPK